MILECDGETVTGDSVLILRACRDDCNSLLCPQIHRNDIDSDQSLPGPQNIQTRNSNQLQPPAAILSRHHVDGTALADGPRIGGLQGR